ncbi:MAG: 5'/3'-nucleotidase SurE [Armatimonadota bacterium]
MNILITNDDGIHASGIMILKQTLDKIAKVYVVAPDRPRSASGHSITLHKPLRAEHVKLSDGSFGYSSNGTPSDCVSLGLQAIIEEPVDFVVSGINLGPNLGWDLTYSGTVSAAMEGAIIGVPPIAVSVASFDSDVDYQVAADIVLSVIEVLKRNILPEHFLLNINVPPLSADKIKSIEVTKQGKRRYAGKIMKRTDPFGRDYYWLGGDDPVDYLDEETDVKAISEGKVSITPIHLDLTDYNSLDVVRNMGVEELLHKLV